MPKSRRRSSVERAVTAVLLLAVALLVSLGVLSVRQARLQGEAAGWVTHTQDVIEEIRNVEFGIAEAESAVRGFGITRDEAFLDEVEPAIARATGGAARVRELTRDNVEQQVRIAALARKIDRRADMLRAYVVGARAGRTQLAHGAHALSLEIERDVEQMLVVERMLLATRTAATRERTEANRLSSAAVTVFASLLLIGTMVTLARELRRRHAAEGELSLLLELGEHLHACRNVDEALEVARTMLPRLFPEVRGAISFVDPSRDAVEVGTRWGEGGPEIETTFEPEACWALRRGQVHLVDEDGGTACRHFASSDGIHQLCQPLSANGEPIGLLHLWGAGALGGARLRASAVGEQLALALANLQLREVLRMQSIRDPLTGLFNRRYTEETMARELARAARGSTSVGVVMIDVDHFKRFNDTFGHDAGDAVLASIARVLRSTTRASDVASRMGGEELLVVLPNADAEQTRVKAEELRRAVEELAVEHQGRPLGPVTISLGVASFSVDGTTSEVLLRAADKALYEAKRGGRNRVCVAARSA